MDRGKRKTHKQGETEVKRAGEECTGRPGSEEDINGEEEIKISMFTKLLGGKDCCTVN